MKKPETLEECIKQADDQHSSLDNTIVLLVENETDRIKRANIFSLYEDIRHNEGIKIENRGGVPYSFILNTISAHHLYINHLKMRVDDLKQMKKEIFFISKTQFGREVQFSLSPKDYCDKKAVYKYIVCIPDFKIKINGLNWFYFDLLPKSKVSLILSRNYTPNSNIRN